MAITTSILTGGANNHQTTSEEVNAVYTDFVSEGIVGTLSNTSGVAPATGGFAVNAQGTPDATVAITAGVAYVTGTPTSQNSQTFRVKNSASTNLSISANSSGSTKYDWIYIKLDATKLATPNTAGDDVATIVASRSSSAASDDGTPPTYGYPIAIVTVANGFSTITNSNIRDIRAQTAVGGSSTGTSDGWNSLSSLSTFTVATGYNNGNKSYTVNSSADLTSVLSPGMRFKVNRGTTPPTQCADLEADSSQYASKTTPSGITFTDDFTCEGWINLESYPSVASVIVSRITGTTGWQLYVDVTGVIVISAFNSTEEKAVSTQSVPLNKWVHVAASADLSGNNFAIYLNGVSIPLTSTGSLSALVQGGDLMVGKSGKGAYYVDGKIADVRVWSVVRTQTQIRDNMNQQLVGNETNLVAYFKLNGDWNDSTSNANNMTASGGPSFVTDNPMKATEYGIITKVTSTQITVFTGTDYNIPNGTLSSPYYSTQKVPYGFPTSADKWTLEFYYGAGLSKTSASADTWYNIGSASIIIPIGAWSVDYFFNLTAAVSSGTFAYLQAALSTSSSSPVDLRLTSRTQSMATASTTQNQAPVVARADISVSTETTYYILALTHRAGDMSIFVEGSLYNAIRAVCSYL